MRRGIPSSISYIVTAGHGTIKYVNRSLGYWRTGGLNLLSNPAFHSSRKLVRLGNSFSGTEMDGWWRVGLFQQTGGIGG